jgi:hypothetical protein
MLAPLFLSCVLGDFDPTYVATHARDLFTSGKDRQSGYHLAKPFLMHAIKDAPTHPVGYFTMGRMEMEMAMPTAAGAQYLWQAHLLDTKNVDMQRSFFESMGNCARMLCSSRFVVSDCLPGTGIKSMQKPASAEIIELPAGAEYHPSPHFSQDRNSVVLLPNLAAMSGVESPTGDQCWLYANEHASFLTVNISELVYNRLHMSGSEAVSYKDSIQVVDGPAGSILHVLDFDSFFHFLKEGLSAVLMLLEQTTHQVAEPDTARFISVTPVSCLSDLIPGYSARHSKSS